MRSHPYYPIFDSDFTVYSFRANATCIEKRRRNYITQSQPYLLRIFLQRPKSYLYVYGIDLDPFGKDLE